MVDRVTFIQSISGINYPEMIVQFFDQFIALKQIVENTGTVNVEANTDRSITFVVTFKNAKNKIKALSAVEVGQIIIYGRPIYVSIQDLSDTELRFILQ